MISTATRKAYSEVDEFLELLNYRDREKIPQKLRNLFKEEKDKAYKKGIVLEKTIEEQNLRKETLAIIALLNLKYWCEDEEEKQRLIEIYNNNEKKASMELQEQLNNLNKRSKNIDDEVQISQTVPCVRESLWQRLISKIKKLFKR